MADEGGFSSKGNDGGHAAPLYRKEHEVARKLDSERDAQRTLFAFYRGREDREQGKPEEAPKSVKGSLKYKAFYSAGYYGDLKDADMDIYR